jgi:two-component system chemotaxis response regulator CheB
MTERENSHMKLVLVVTDIGGPPALHELLSQLPKNYGVPIVVLQSFDVGVLETSTAVLKRTLQLEVSLIEEATELHSGHVYFTRPEVCHHLTVNKSGLVVEPGNPGACEGIFADTIRSFAAICGEELTVVFLSGRGKGEELIKGCRLLAESGGAILVLDRHEAVVSDMGKQVLKYAGLASEVGATEIVEYLAGLSGKSGEPISRRVTQR